MKNSCYAIVVSVLAASLVCSYTPAHAEVLNIMITDSSDNPVSNAVVSAYSHNQQSRPATTANKTVIVDQVDKTFVSQVTPVQVGTAISFPNHDQIRHHVYSFSSAKTFEIPLYKGVPTKPIVFKQEGIVTLGCNIHDWMFAYIVVIASPYFATTDQQGRTSLTLPAGDYELRFWHQDADEKTQNSQQSITINPTEETSIPIELSLKPSSFWRRSPASIINRGRYR
ncbi:MAG: methylamine utilization protein [Methylococcales bacterium]